MLQDSNIQLFVVAHKEFDNMPSGRTVIGVGGNRLEVADVYDNMGDNIAEKNASYCELTALYWMWKNSDADYVGLEHYRRFFCSRSVFRAKPLSKERISKLIIENDIILPKRNRAKPSIYGNYIRKHYKSDMDICVDIIKAMPEYADIVDVALAAKRETVCNMFVMSKELADDYCSFIFYVLSEAEKRIDISERNAYDKRVFGFLAERLFNVWIYRKGLNAYYAPIYNVGDCPPIKKIKGLFRRIKKKFKKK